MADYSPNLNLYLPSRNDSDISVDTSLTDNFNKIDTHASDVTAQLADITSQKGYQAIIDKMVTGQTVKIVCYGDSVTYGYVPGSGTQTSTPYPLQLQTKLRDFYQNQNITVYNEGYSGRQSDELASDTYIAYVTRHTPDMVVVMVGINDNNGNSYGPVTPIGDYINNLDTIRTKLGVPVLLLPPTPTFGYVGDTTATDYDKKDRIQTYVKAMKDYAYERGIDLVDLNQGIYNYYYWRLSDIYSASPDITHYTDLFFQHIGDYVFTFGFTNMDIVVSDQKFFPAIHAIYQFRPQSPNYYESNANPEHWNLMLKSGTATTSAYAYVFINQKSVDLLLNLVADPASSGANILTIDGVSFTISSYAQSTMWNIKRFIQSLNYGLHKITFAAVDDSANGRGLQFLINGMEFIPTWTNRTKVTQSQSGNITANKRKDILFNGMKKLVLGSSPSGWSYDKVIDIGDNLNKHLRIYAEIGSNSGIGFGSYDVKNGSSYVEAPIYVLWQNGSTNFSVMSLPLSNDNTFSNVFAGATTIVTGSMTSLSVQTFCIIDVVTDGNTTTFYVNGTQAVQITQAQTAISDLSVWVFGYSPATTKILRIEDLTNILVGEYLEGDEYFDTVAKVKKVYDGSTWKTITLT